MKSMPGRIKRYSHLSRTTSFLKRSQPLSSYAGFAGLAAAAIRYNLLKNIVMTALSYKKNTQVCFCPRQHPNNRFPS